MRSLTATLVVGMLTASAYAFDVRFYFTSSADSAGLTDTTHAFDNTDGQHTDGASYQLNDALPKVAVPRIRPWRGEFLYLWAEFEGEKTGRKIQGINLVMNDRDFKGEQLEEDRGVYFGDDEEGETGERLRWNLNSKTTDPMTISGPGANALVNRARNEWLYMGSKNGRRVALLGAIDFASGTSGEIRLGLGKNGVSYSSNRDNYSAPMVKFGGNDEQFDGNVRQAPDYYWSSDADAVIQKIPEPASALAFGAGLVALSAGRRRWMA